MSLSGYTGEVRIFMMATAPAGWFRCDGQLLDISAHGDLFQVIGTRFGGDGVSTFALPDLRGRVPMGAASGLAAGSRGGVESHALTIDEMPPHSHAMIVSTSAATSSDPTGGSLAAAPATLGDVYGPPTVPHAMAREMVENAGEGAAHDNMQPFVVLVFMICVDDGYPPIATISAQAIGGLVRSSIGPRNGYPGEIRLFAGNFAPQSWLQCTGVMVLASQYTVLYGVIGSTFGNGYLLRIPDLSAGAPIHAGAGTGLTPRVLGEEGGSETVTLTIPTLPTHTHQMMASDGPATGGSATSGSVLGETQGRIYAKAGGTLVQMASAVPTEGYGRPHENRQPYQACFFIAAGDGPAATSGDAAADDYPFLGEIRMLSGDQVPSGWFPCDGRLLEIGRYQALFAIFGNAYGGDGKQQFALPDFRGRVPIQAGWSRDGTRYTLGQAGGRERVPLSKDHLPPHLHPLQASASTALSNDPAGKVLGAPFGGEPLYRAEKWPAGIPIRLETSGGTSEHENMQPYLAINFIISMTGFYPARDY